MKMVYVKISSYGENEIVSMIRVNSVIRLCYISKAERQIIIRMNLVKNHTI